jgi:hypothetical protein
MDGIRLEQLDDIELERLDGIVRIRTPNAKLNNCRPNRQEFDSKNRSAARRQKELNR